jgi:hypothetical protein
MKIKRFYGRMIALICAISMFFYAVPIAALAQEAIPPGTIPYGASPAKPAYVVANFPTGTHDIVYQSQFDSLNGMADFLKSNPNYKVVLVGTVSDLAIYGGCYVDPNDPKFFDLHSGPKHIKYDNKRDTNEECQIALAKSRDFAVADWLINAGVNPQQIFILDFYALTMNSGGNLPNQSVVAWWVTTTGLIIDGQTSSTDDQSYIPGPTAATPCESQSVKVIFNLPACCKQTEEKNQVNGVTLITYKVDCSACEVKPEVVTEKQCPWYNHGPCMNTGEKIFWGSLGAAALVALILAGVNAFNAEAKTSNTKACSGSNC